MQIIATITGAGLRTKKALTKTLEIILIYIHVWTLQMGQGTHMCNYMCITCSIYCIHITIIHIYMYVYYFKRNSSQCYEKNLKPNCKCKG